MDRWAERLRVEIAHGRRLAERPPRIWDWATAAAQRRADRRARLICERGRIRKGDRVLELGCGTGLFAGRVRRATAAEVIGVDVSRELVARARAGQPDIPFAVGDAHRLAFEEGSFDVVFGSSVLHHLELDAALVEIFRVLRPAGRMVFAEPNLLNPQVFLTKRVPWLKRWMDETPHETAFTRWDLARRLGIAGFVGVVVLPYDFLHPLTPRVLIGAVSALGAALERVPLAREIAGSLIASGEKPGGEPA